ncbi:hypothetical protein [Paenibacillus cremeus]|uniref:Uncharacterized protein n=1 Tax=Paenibacillus cremeus TaxID=2163881 RepID=A0A559K6U1_9BACL|nr:hypothetical protein [Paenibacillus cremeus]TVY07836.1 hypothetical protein FPZ49_22020 [Paenibacillus cremeus]
MDQTRSGRGLLQRGFSALDQPRSGRRPNAKKADSTFESAFRIFALCHNRSCSSFTSNNVASPLKWRSKSSTKDCAAELDWHDVQVGAMVEQENGWPTVVVNCHRARGLSECRYGSGQSFNHMIYSGSVRELQPVFM